MSAKVELFIDLDAVAADAGGALEPGAQASLYDALDWFRLTQAHVLPETPPLVARARSAQGTAWLFMAEHPRGRAEPYGSWYTLRYAPIFTEELGASERSDLLIAIAREMKRRLAHVSLGPLDDRCNNLLCKAFDCAGWWTGSHVQTVNWVAHTHGEDFECYWARRPGQLRSTVRRKSAKAKLDIRILDAFAPDAWADYEAVFAASWKGEEGSPAFLWALAERTASWGRMRMGLAYALDGTPLAAQFWTVDRDVATIHKLAYVDAAKALSPGSILSHAMFAHVIDRDRPRLIDFGTGDDAYKADWMDEKRPLHRFDAYNPASVTGIRDYARSRAAALVARWRSA